MESTSHQLGYLLAVGIVVLIGAHTVSLIRRGRWRVLDPLYTFWGGVVMVYVVQPVQHGELMARWHAPGTLALTLAWSLFGFAFVAAGYESRLGVRGGLSLPALPARLAPQRLLLAAGVLIGLGLVGYGHLIGTVGNVWEWLAVSRGATEWRIVNGYLAMLTNFLPLGVMLLLFVVNFRRMPLPITAAAWGLAALLLTWHAYMGARSLVIAGVMTMLGAWYLPRRGNPPAWLLAGTFAGLLVVVQFMSHYRGNFVNLSFNLDQIDMEEAQQRVLPEFMGGNRKVQRAEVVRGIDFNCVMSVVDLVPGEIDYNWGYCLLEFFTRPVPRAWWPDKLYPHYEAFTPIYERAHLSDWEVPNTRQRILAGPAFTFVGHWYAVGGPWVLAAAGFLTGCFFRLIRTLYDRVPGSEGDTLIYFVLLPVGFFEAAATPLFWVFTTPFLVLVLLVIVWFCQQAPSRVASPAGRIGNPSYQPVGG